MYIMKKMLTISIAVLSEVEVVAQAMILLTAGHEMTANTLQYLTFALALHPQVQEKVVREIHQQLGDVSFSFMMLAIITTKY